MNLIALADRNWGIGYRGKRQVTIPQDQKYFHQLTTGKVLVMGRRTLESLPNGLAPAGRTSIVLSRRPGLQVRHALVVSSAGDALAELQNYESEDIYVIGGESIFKTFLTYCDTAYITKIDRAFESDAYLENLDASGEWKIAAGSDEQTYFNLEFRFLRYERV